MPDDLWEIAWLQPVEAMAWWQDKVPLTKDQWDTLEEIHRARAFTVADVTDLHYLSAIYEALDQALTDGLTVKEFDQLVAELGEQRGYTGAAPYHLHTVFNNNMTSAYMAGRYRQMTDPVLLKRRPIWMYDAVGDMKTRPAHQALDGQARPADDPFWGRYYPPNDHN